MPFLAPIGAAIIAGATATAAAVGTALGAGALGAAVANGIMAVGYGLASLTGAAGIGAAFVSWSTVLATTTALTPPKVGQGPAGTQVDFQADPNAGIPLVIGRTGTAGKIVHVNTTGQEHKNGHIYYLAALSAGPIEGVESFSANDTVIAFAGDVAQTGQYKEQMWLRVTSGTQPDDALMPGGFNPSWASELTAAHKISGVAVALWTMYFSPEAYPNGTPKPMFVVKGPAVYDPRQDDTYPGGSGSQRWDDEASWSFAGRDNPFLQALTYIIGRRSNGVVTHGLGAPVETIDLPAFIYGAGVCEANGWTVNGEVSSSDRKRDVLRVMLQAGGGEMVPTGGRLSCTVRAPRVSLATITGDDLVGAASVPGTKSRRDRINQGVPVFRSEAHGWEMVPADPVKVPAYIEEDGGLRSKEMTYQLVSDAAQAAQLCAYDLVDAREFEPVVLPLRPHYMGYRPGDCLTVNEPELLMVDQPVVVTQRQIDLASGVVTLTVRSETPGKHDFALGRTGNPPPLPGLGGIDPGVVPAPSNGSWTAVGGVLQGADGASQPAIIVTGAVDDPNVQNVIVEHRLVLDWPTNTSFGEWAQSEAPASTKRVELRGLVSAGHYHVQVRYRTIRSVENPLLALDLGIVQAGALVSAGVTTIGGRTPAQVIEDLEQALSDSRKLTMAALETSLRLIGEFEERARDTMHQGEKIKRIVVDDDEVFEEGKYSLLKRLQLQGFVTDNGSAFQFNLTNIKVGDDETFADYLTGVTTRLDDNQAAVVSEASARSTAISAEASARTSAISTVNGNIAAAVSSLTTYVDHTGAVATWMNALNVSFGGNFSASIANTASIVSGMGATYTLALDVNGHVSGMRLVNTGALSSFVVVADEIGFANGPSTVYPFAIVGGVVKATNFEADRVVANSIVTNSLVGAAVTGTAWDEQSYGGYLSGSAVSVFSLGYTTVVGASPHKITFEVTCSNTGADAGVAVVLLVDGTPVATRYGFFKGSFTETRAFRAFLQPSAGGHTYTLTAATTAGSGTGCILQVSNMDIQESKR